MTERSIRWRHRLSVKLASLIGLVILTIIGAVSVVVLKMQERHYIGEVLRGAALLSDTIKRSTNSDMLYDRRDAAYEIMDTIGRQEGIEKVRIFNKEGRVTFSTDRSEIGSLVDKRTESCYACHAAGKPLSRLAVPSRGRIYRHDGHRILGMVTPVYNEASCATAACHEHPSSQRVLGVIDVDMSLAQIDQQMAESRRDTALLLGATVPALALLVMIFVTAFVVRPVGALLRGTRQVARGDLDHPIRIGSLDELGLLAGSFNTMTASLRNARQELNALMESLERQVEARSEDLRQAQAQLVQTEKLSSLGKLSASIAHEINNPLAGILTFAKLLVRKLDGTVDDATRTSCIRDLKLVQRETERCSAIVRNLLDFARQRPLSLKDVDLNTAIEEALLLIANQMTIQGIELRKELRPLPSVCVDFGQLRQAFLNVLMNACEAMPRGGRLTVCTGHRDGQVEIEIADTGVGMTPEQLARVCDPFFTTKDKGTGLGMSVVYGIIERHAGRLDIRSQPGGGTTVLIRLKTKVAAVGGA